MQSRHPVICGLALSMLAAGLCSPSATATPVASPNVIYILADDLGYGELGSYGQTLIHTPHLDDLAAGGMRFTQHYAGAPVCAPSRGTLQTGKHTGHAHIRDNYELPRSQLPLPASEVTVGELMQQAHYRTGFIGKWGLGGNDSEGQPNRQGYHFFYGYLDQKIAHNYYPTHLWRNDQQERLTGNPEISAHQPLRGIKYLFLSEERRKVLHKPYQGKDYAPDLMLDESLAFLRRNKDQPFFLVMAGLVPHLSLQVPDDSLLTYLGQFDETPYKGTFGYTPHGYPKSAYAAMISHMDRNVGSIMKELKVLGIDNKTLVIFSSDNGPAFSGQVATEYFDSTGGLRGRKASVYEGGLRVPMLARWPGVIPAASESDHVSAFWDIMPTLAALTDQAPPAGTDGISLLPTLRGGEQQRQHQSLYWEFHSKGGLQAVRFADPDSGKLRWKAVRTGARTRPNRALKLYDLILDPHETKDLASVHPELVLLAERTMNEQREVSEVNRWNFK